MLGNIRLAMMQLLLQRQGLKLSPITALYYIAPAVVPILLTVALAKVPHFFHAFMSVGSPDLLTWCPVRANFLGSFPTAGTSLCG